MSPLLQFLLPLLIASLPRAAAQGTNATCSPGFEWMSNSKGQSPCLVSSYLFTPCSSPAESWVYPLEPGFHYNTPLDNPQSATPCRCNTVLFSMIAACATCQGQGDWIIPFSTYSQNCTNVFIQKYPENIPIGTAVPAYAYLDITFNNTFDPAAAEAVAVQGLPESTAVAPSSTSTSKSSTSSQTVGSTTSPSNDATDAPSNNGSSDTSTKKSSSVGPIVGGVIGGIIALVAIGLAAFFIIRRQRSKAIIQTTAANPFDINGQYERYSDKSPTQEIIQPLVTGPGPSTRLYDPNDPTTFPSGTGPDAYPTSNTSTQYPATNSSSLNYTNPSGYNAPESLAGYQSSNYKGVPEL